MTGPEFTFLPLLTSLAIKKQSSILGNPYIMCYLHFFFSPECFPLCQETFSIFTLNQNLFFTQDIGSQTCLHIEFALKILWLEPTTRNSDLIGLEYCLNIKIYSSLGDFNIPWMFRTSELRYK